MTNERKEAADIARSVRRYIERERAGGGADLLADGATVAGRKPAPAAAGTNLFGEPEAAPAPKKRAAAVSVLDEPALVSGLLARAPAPAFGHSDVRLVSPERELR